MSRNMSRSSSCSGSVVETGSRNASLLKKELAEVLNQRQSQKKLDAYEQINRNVNNTEVLLDLSNDEMKFMDHSYDRN